MSKVFVLTEAHWIGDDCERNVLGIYKSADKAYEAAQARVWKQDHELPKKLPSNQFVWTFNDLFTLDDILNYSGVLYMSIGDHDTDSIVEYFIIDIQEGDFKDYEG